MDALVVQLRFDLMKEQKEDETHYSPSCKLNIIYYR